jgi:hypothetical protein
MERGIKNHFQELSLGDTSDMYIPENFDEKSSRTEKFQVNFIEQFQLKELFWKEETDRSLRNSEF